MSDSSTPTVELGLTPKDIGMKQSETSSRVQKLAQANGHFYNSLLDVYLSKNNRETRQQQLVDMIKVLPEHARPLYKKGLQTFSEELQENHVLLGKHRGEEVRYLVSCLMESEGKTQEQIDEVFRHIAPEQARFVEPAEGVGIIQVEHELYDYLVEAKIITGGSEAICLSSNTRDEPSFVIVRRHRRNKGLDEDGMSPAENSTVRHEFHHFVWNFLQRGKFVREPREASTELSKAFGSFRSELAAYVIEGRSLSEIGPWAMTYTEDKDIQKIANDTKAFAFVCMEIARNKGVDLTSFLYPAMTSRNFVELKNNYMKLVPLDIDIDLSTVAILYSLQGRYDISVDSVKDLLTRKGSHVSTSVMSEFAAEQLRSGKLTRLGDFYNRVNSLQQFAESMGISDFSLRDVSDAALRQLLPFPEETRSVILNMPRTITQNIPLGKDPSTFYREFVSIWRIHDEKMVGAYSQIINSSPEMRQAFNIIKEDLIITSERSFREEYGYERRDPERQREIDIEVDKRVKLLRTL